MRRFETMLALVAVVLASIAAFQIPGQIRILCALTAMLLLSIVGSSRLRAALGPRKERKAPGLDPYERARKIQEQRSKRYDR